MFDPSRTASRSPGHETTKRPVPSGPLAFFLGLLHRTSILSYRAAVMGDLPS